MGLGIGEIILVMFIAVLLFGSKKLPELGRAAGHTLREFKKATSGIMDSGEDLEDRKNEYSKANKVDQSDIPKEKETD